MHKNGVNIRLLGHLLAVVGDARNRTLIITEMIARFVKNLVRQQLRKVDSADTRACHEVVISVFNLLFGTSDRSQEFWQVVVPLGLAEKFGCACSIALPSLVILA